MIVRALGLAEIEHGTGGGVGVGVGAGVGVGPGVGVGVGVGVGAGVGVGIGVGIGVGVGFGVGVAFGIGVGDGDGEGEGDDEGVAVGIGEGSGIKPPDTFALKLTLGIDPSWKISESMVTSPEPVMFTLLVRLPLLNPTETSLGVRPRQSKVTVRRVVVNMTPLSNGKLCVVAVPAAPKSIVTA
jgi:hypothetical protein